MLKAHLILFPKIQHGWRLLIKLGKSKANAKQTHWIEWANSWSVRVLVEGCWYHVLWRMNVWHWLTQVYLENCCEMVCCCIHQMFAIHQHYSAQKPTSTLPSIWVGELQWRSITNYMAIVILANCLYVRYHQSCHTKCYIINPNRACGTCTSTFTWKSSFHHSNIPMAVRLSELENAFHVHFGRAI